MSNDQKLFLFHLVHSRGQSKEKNFILCLVGKRRISSLCMDGSKLSVVSLAWAVPCGFLAWSVRFSKGLEATFAVAQQLLLGTEFWRRCEQSTFQWDRSAWLFWPPLEVWPSLGYWLPPAVRCHYQICERFHIPSVTQPPWTHNLRNLWSRYSFWTKKPPNLRFSSCNNFIQVSSGNLKIIS